MRKLKKSSAPQGALNGKLIFAIQTGDEGASGSPMMTGAKMTIVIVQCRLSSTRLPNKAMMTLGGKPLVSWTLNAMKRVAADNYVLATDEASLETLRPLALESGYEIMAGPLENVLERFCSVIRKFKADIAIRATADNPFLFYEAAQSLLDEYNRHNDSSSFNGKCAYITYTSLPHGSGVEVINCASLLEAAKNTTDPFEMEHVGPALYNHKDKFNCVMLRAPARFNHPELRTTVDTPSDFRRAHLIEKAVRQIRAGSERDKDNDAPYTTEEIISAFSAPCIVHPVLFVPSIQAGMGTGHLRRCVSAAAKISGFVLLPADMSECRIQADGKQNAKDAENAFESTLPPAAAADILQGTEGFEMWQAVHDMPLKGEYGLIVIDRFALKKDEAARFVAMAPVADIDDGGGGADLCDCLIDIIPSQINRAANIACSTLMELPHRIRTAGQAEKAADIHKVLVCFGGEDPAKLTFTAAIEVLKALRAEGSVSLSVTALTAEEAPSGLDEDITVMPLVKVLRETLADYDLVITHYGLTAYEAAAAGCAVLLCATAPLHGKLAKKYGFVCLDKRDITAKKMSAVLVNTKALYPKARDEAKLPHSAVCTQNINEDVDSSYDAPISSRLLGEEYSLSSVIKRVSYGRRMNCPVCGKGADNAGAVAARTAEHTYRRCPACGMIYMSWTMAEKARYNADYFGGQYKAQYGKTYLEDFESIKAQGIRRMGQINRIAKKKGTILDIGCAYGPFLQAAHDNKWDVFGIDVSMQAVSYVQSSLLFPASAAHFPDFDAAREFGISQFDAVTMWFVIEHFQDLDSVLRAVSQLVKADGVFAFSTPSGEGVSAKLSRQKFFEQSPSDHYTIWEPSMAASILKKYGFRAERIVSTGHHAERFPVVQKHKWSESSPLYKAVDAASKMFRMGDTCEIYCKRMKG